MVRKVVEFKVSVVVEMEDEEAEALEEWEEENGLPVEEEDAPKLLQSLFDPGELVDNIHTIEIVGISDE